MFVCFFFFLYFVFFSSDWLVLLWLLFCSHAIGDGAIYERTYVGNILVFLSSISALVYMRACGGKCMNTNQNINDDGSIESIFLTHRTHSQRCHSLFEWTMPMPMPFGCTYHDWPKNEGEREFLLPNGCSTAHFDFTNEQKQFWYNYRRPKNKNNIRWMCRQRVC